MSLKGNNLHEKLDMMWPYADTISITQHNGFVTEGARGHAAVIQGKGLETKKMTTSCHLHTFLIFRRTVASEKYFCYRHRFLL